MYIRPELRAPIAGAVGLGVGLAAGYFIGKRNGDVFEVVVDDDVVIEPEVVVIAECENCGSRSDEGSDIVNVIDDRDLPSAIYGKHLKEEARKDMDRIQYGNHPSADPEEPTPSLSIVVDEDVWNQEEEDENRSPDSPYVISLDEWKQDQRGYAQSALRWFTVEQILVDEQTIEIPNPEKVVGRLEFGRGSDDGDVVYIRNEKLEAEYEITRINGSYITEVTGLEAEDEFDQDELRHSQRLPKFRLRD